MVRDGRNSSPYRADGTGAEQLEDMIQHTDVLTGNEYRDDAVVTIQSQAGDA
jgi:hypothetical protein